MTAQPDSLRPPDPLPIPAEALLACLDDLGIAYQLHRHAPVFTVEESAPLKKTIPGTHCRNLFLRDKKEAMFLVVAANDTPVDLKTLPGILGCARLSFGSAERLWRTLGVRPGAVCPFALINDREAHAVTVILDRDMMDSALVGYHPMENHMTVCLSPADLLRFIAFCGHKPHIVSLTQTSGGN